MSNRVEREKGAYNSGLKRGIYRKLFHGHSGYFFDRDRLLKLTEVMRFGDAGDMLEVGSQSWLHFIEETNVFPRALTCINISETEIEKGRAYESEKKTRVHPVFLRMDAHNLEFPDGRFDLVFGGGILHHLDFEKALFEIARVLRPGGLMVFREPLDNNPVGRLVRVLTPLARTTDEKPLRSEHLKLLKKYFDCEMYFEQLFSVPVGILSGLMFSSPDNILTRLAFAVDKAILRKFSFLGSYFRHVLVIGKRRVTESKRLCSRK